MTDFLKTIQSNAILQAVLFIILGLVLLFFPGITLVAIVYGIGAIFVLSGIISLVAYFKKDSPSYKMSGALTAGIFCLVIALIMFVFPIAIAGFFSVLLGAILILCGIVNTIRSIALRGVSTSLWMVGCILGIITIIGGAIIIWNPFDTSALFIMILGILFLTNGITGIFVELAVRKNLKSDNAN